MKKFCFNENISTLKCLTPQFIRPTPVTRNRGGHCAKDSSLMPQQRKRTEAGDWWSPHSTSLRRAESQISTTFLPSITIPICTLSLLSLNHLPPPPPTKKTKYSAGPGASLPLWRPPASLQQPRRQKSGNLEGAAPPKMLRPVGRPYVSWETWVYCYYLGFGVVILNLKFVIVKF